MKIDFDKASFRDFENIPGLGVNERSALFLNYINRLKERGLLHYRYLISSPCSPVVELELPGKPPRPYVSLVSNDYLGFTQHPKVKKAAIAGIEDLGTGSGASPAIGGNFALHEALEKKIASFFRRENAILYTTGYTANSATLQCLLKKEDIAIIDAGVHTSVIEGCLLTNVKTFPHNNLEALERILRLTKDQYRTKMVVIDGVYSQDGDLAPLKEIVKLVKDYDALLMMDDAHGTGVIGATGRGVIELKNLWEEVDIISGTFSKTFGQIGGYVVGSKELVNFLKYQSRQHLFSVTATPASAGILKAIDLIDEEPIWQRMLWENVEYLRSGLLGLGLDLGTSASAILPVKLGDRVLAGKVAGLLLDAGVYANPIMYPAVALNDARIRMSVMATHSREQLDQVLNAYEYAIAKLNLKAVEVTNED
ncbi:aminotransferase class I/II-fold pyridoxal phosphate-dependent enzyme [Pedobacter sp. SYSU D00535]|uniref:aminotransferase class I/II-fold pyridoxal phosphate-dependent enzyme n=1 Tax=Pedobacter sp. SYSU D00535 TaxID=2810308 RepID=UPI001A95D08D|nr:aminotransferase class I/II-fold pyridoxal phosphate-dependent enzyme [Pedobacter sp. SYSU D00535]